MRDGGDLETWVAHSPCGDRPVGTHPILTAVGSLPRLAENDDAALSAAVELQRSHGLQLLTDGEQRGDMLSLYESLPGIRVEGGKPRVVARIRPLDDPAAFHKVRDLDRLRSRFPGPRFKVSLTGPTTFLFASAATGAGPEYRSVMDPRLHDDLTEAIRPLAREVARRGAELQLDEPFLSQGMRDYAPALKNIDAIASEASRESVTLHVCGGLVRSRVLDALFRLDNVSTLSLAFAGDAERENLGLVVGRPWEERRMSLGVGCAKVQVSRPEEVMDPAAVEALLRQIISAAGPSRVRTVTPDCGLRATASPLVPAILDGLRGGFERVFPPGG